MKLYGNLFFGRPLSLGDSFALNAIVHEYAEKSNELHLPVKPSYYETLQCLYQDWPNIIVCPFQNEEQENEYIKFHNLNRLHFQAIRPTRIFRNNSPVADLIFVNWDRQNYENFGIPFEYKYKKFRLPKHIDGADELYYKLTNGINDYCLVHQRTQDHPDGMGLDIDTWRKQNNLQPFRVIEIHEGITSNMLQFVPLIQNAREIHCVASSFFNLVDNMILNIPAAAFFHDRRRNSLMQVNSALNNDRWIMMYYDYMI